MVLVVPVPFSRLLRFLEGDETISFPFAVPWHEPNDWAAASMGKSTDAMIQRGSYDDAKFTIKKERVLQPSIT